jgi:hypothetical protein
LYEPPADAQLRLCPFYWLTSLPCPFCGLTRGLCALAKGDWGGAVELHALSPLVMALLTGALWPGARVPPAWQARSLPALAALFLSYGLARIAATL